MSDKVRKAKIKKEYDRLAAHFVTASPATRAVAEGLLQNGAFSRITLEELQKEISKNGITEAYQNGNNQFGNKISASFQAYNSALKNYITLIKKLNDLLPKDAPAIGEFELD